jgi:two-component system, OmpR family, sensor histidine kinase CiaH
MNVGRLRPRRRWLPPEVAHAARVALAASLLVCIVYAACVTVLDQVVSTRLVASVDQRLQERLSDVTETGQGRTTDADDIDETPIYVWRIGSNGLSAAVTSHTPALPRTAHFRAGKAQTVRLAGGSYRLDAARVGGDLLVAGQSLAENQHLTSVLRDGEALAAPVLLFAMFVGALTIGLRALRPVEQSRRRQLEFTADASHELRTPLSVITAETSIALSTPRPPADYRSALTRIERESKRLRSIVEDLLWLARFDSAPPQPGDEPIDLGTLATECADRFTALATAQRSRLLVQVDSSVPALITAPPEWIDRLAGVLVDNACRYAGTEGTVIIGVGARGNRIWLAVEDSGPGVPPEDRDRLFDRFHRATEDGAGAGLGLAIADSIAKTTGGQWRVDESELGGALFEVSWRRAGRVSSAPLAVGQSVSEEPRPSA